MEVKANQGLKVTVVGELRTGICEKCGAETEKEYYMDGERKRVRKICPKCGGMGKLIVKTTSIQPPAPLKCLRPGCIFKFFLTCLYTSLFERYHHYRVKYAVAHKHKNIPDKYRTGEPAPENIRQAIIEILKLQFRRITWRSRKLGRTQA